MRDTDEILSCLRLEVKEIGRNHFQIAVRFAMFVLRAPIGADSVRKQLVAHITSALGDGPHGEQVASNKVTPEGFEAKYEKRAKMSVQLQVGEAPGYLKARFIGAATTEEVERQFESLAEKCKSTKKNRLLLDFTGVPTDISLVDSYELGRRTQVFAQYKCKVAAVCKPEHHDSTCFLGTVAQNRWVDLRVFTNVEDALEWLLKE